MPSGGKRQPLGLGDRPLGMAGSLRAGSTSPGPLGLGLEFHLDMPGPHPQMGDFGHLTPSPLIAEGVAYDLFVRAVLARQIENARRNGHPYYPTVPDSELEALDAEHKLRKAAAAAYRRLVAKARLDAKAAGQKKVRIGIGSAYRDYKREWRLWHDDFPQYYAATARQRAKARGGPHGPKAVELLAVYISPRKAAPGYSNHSDGIAVDFVTSEGGPTLSASGKQKDQWRRTWFYKWLVKHAKDFGFHPLSSEPWHWNYLE